jgi:hypothetical protein
VDLGSRILKVDHAGKSCAISKTEGSEVSDLLFLDTEWATDAMRELVSLALVSANGTKRFYAERDPLPEVASTFVRTTVYPLLSRGDDACPDYEFTQRLREFVASGNNPRIHFDAMLDKVQLNHTLAQFGYDKRHSALCASVCQRCERVGRARTILQNTSGSLGSASSRDGRRRGVALCLHESDGLTCGAAVMCGRINKA